MTPRGIRNHNPGNIKELRGDPTIWEGERAQNTDPIFEEFVTPVFGIRALVRVLRNYQRLYELRTIRQVLGRFAPAGDGNPTLAYIKVVAVAIGVTPDTQLDLNDPDVMNKLVRAIVRFENGAPPQGGDWYSDEIYKTGIEMGLKP